MPPRPRRVIATFQREQLPEGRIVPVIHPPGHLVVVRVGERVFALDHSCCHGGASLLNASVRGETITCRAHGYCFDLATGALRSPAGEALCQPTFAVERVADAWAVLERRAPDDDDRADDNDENDDEVSSTQVSTSRSDDAER